MEQHVKHPYKTFKMSGQLPFIKTLKIIIKFYYHSGLRDIYKED